MNTIRHYILILSATVAAILLSSCSGEEPGGPKWEPGKAPMALTALAPEETRATTLNPNLYDIYTCGIHYNGEAANGYYTVTEIEDGHGGVSYTSVFSKMQYMANKKLFFFEDRFFPLDGEMDLLCYGCTSGKKIEGYCYPSTLAWTETADYMSLDFTGEYDGGFEVIVADRITVHCTPSLEETDMPYAHFHHVQAHLTFKFVWDRSVPANSGIVDRLRITGVTVEDTPVQGICDVWDNVSGFQWHDIVPASPRVPGFHRSLIDYNDGLTIGDGLYIIPQASRKRFIITYSIQNGDMASTSGSRTMKYVVADDPTKAWEVGHRYNYTITIGSAGEFKITNVEVLGFAEEHAENTDIE